MAKIIAKKDILPWLDLLHRKTKVIAPQQLSDRQIAFKALNAKNKVVLGYKTTYLPPKIYFLPPKEVILRYSPKTNKLDLLGKKTSFVLFGLSYADLEAMTQLDEAMLKPYEDVFYKQKRKKATIVGLVNRPIDLAPGGDLVLSRINKTQYRVIEVTEKGKKIAQGKFFKNVIKPKVVSYKPKNSRLREMLFDAELLKDAVSWSWKNDQQMWQKLGSLCLGCGICTYVCPLCFCFSNEDRVSLDGQSCTRCRFWDACTLPQFAKIAGGHDFHKGQDKRYYNWFYHKFVRSYTEQGRPLCVACGRCQKYCPAGLDIEKILIDILKKYLKSAK